MSSTLILAENEENLLKFIRRNNTPSYRQAYSDRTAWLMACLSELAYQPFGQFDEKGTKQLLQEKLDTLLDEGSRKTLDKILHSIFETDNEITNRLLKGGEIDILKTYDFGGTQALLVSTRNYFALAFRGTEATSFVDIKTDANAVITKCPSGGRIHSGFNEAFDLVKKQIQVDLNRQAQSDLNNPENKNKPLIITGHSLGGALAMIATKHLHHDVKDIKIAACYTFGSPRVGDEEWFSGIKTPIYRVVNAVDCVTMLPPGRDTVQVLRIVLRIVFNLLPWGGSFIDKALEKFQGYVDSGDMRYLTNCPKGNYEEVKLTYAVSAWKRIWMLGRCNWNVKKFVRDHAISIYRKKLAIIAIQRNSSTEQNNASRV